MLRWFWLLLSRTLIGLVAAVGIAWVLAVRVPIPLGVGPLSMAGFVAQGGTDAMPSASGNGVEIVQATRAVRWGTQVAWVEPVAGGMDTPETLPELLGGTPLAAKVEARPDWGEFEQYFWRADGWPFVSMSVSWSWTSPGQEPMLTGGLGIPLAKPRYSSLSGGRPDELRAIPLQPVWRGLLLDTGFFAALLLIAPLARTVRRIHRRRAGRCLECGYQLNSSSEGCPECGLRTTRVKVP